MNASGITAYVKYGAFNNIEKHPGEVEEAGRPSLKGERCESSQIYQSCSSSEMIGSA